MRKLLKYTLIGLAVLILTPVALVTYLYLSADMRTPTHAPTTTEHALSTDSLRLYRGNFLRHSRNGLWELKVRGNGFERGEAIGKLAPDLLHYQEKVFVDQIKQIVPSEAYLRFLRFFIVVFNRNLGANITDELRDEIYGISLACTHEYDFIGTPYERQLNYHSAHDLGHAMQDYMLVGCTSFAAWGAQSADSSLIVGRNFDFYMGDDFARNRLVSFYEPERGYRFASVGWAGMTGVLSGMNEAGLTVTINAAKSSVPTSSATPISILTREILQYAATIDEAYAIARSRRTFVSESILVGSARDGRAAVIEKSPEKIALFAGDGSEKICCTNHYQSPTFANDERNRENLATSDSPYRFERLGELMQRYAPLSPQSAAAILRDRRGPHDEPLRAGNPWAINQLIAHHSVIFQPEQLLMWVSTDPWQCGPYVAYDLKKIFALTPQGSTPSAQKGAPFAQNSTPSADASTCVPDPRHELSTPELTLPEDPFVRTDEFRQFMKTRTNRFLKKE